MSRANLPIAIGIVVVTVGVVVGGLALLQAHFPVPADLPVADAATSSSQASADRPGPPGQPAAAPTAAPAAPSAPPQTPPALQALLTELNATLPRLGVRPPARLTAASLDRDLLSLTFNAEFLPYLADRSALDELTAALSDRALAHGYRHLELRVEEKDGGSHSTSELTTTPPARRPRPEPIDDGVRR